MLNKQSLTSKYVNTVNLFMRSFSFVHFSLLYIYRKYVHHSTVCFSRWERARSLSAHCLQLLGNYNLLSSLLVCVAHLDCKFTPNLDPFILTFEQPCSGFASTFRWSWQFALWEAGGRTGVLTSFENRVPHWIWWGKWSVFLGHSKWNNRHTGFWSPLSLRPYCHFGVFLWVRCSPEEMTGCLSWEPPTDLRS